MIGLSACIITKNSVHLIEKTLKSIWNVVDEIIIVDRGSSDGTIDKALKYTDRVYSFEDTDYEKIVGFAVEKATKEYIFLLNPGEFINESQVEMLNALKEKNLSCKNGYKVKYNIKTIEETLSFYIGRIIKKERINNYKNIVVDWFDLENLQSIELDVESHKYDDKLKDNKETVLIASVIKEKPEILKEFLMSIKNLDKSDLNVKYLFVDNNDDDESINVLMDFEKEEENITVINKRDMNLSKYKCELIKHFQDKLIDERAQLKNSIINYVLKNDFQYLFLLETNVIMHEKTLKKLIEDKKDIISNLVLTKCSSYVEPLPQVWLNNDFILFNSIMNKDITYEEIPNDAMEFFNEIKKPGLYKTGGIGGCTLIKRNFLTQGIKFSPLYNISSKEEYSHFSIKAISLGFDLYVDTEYPSYGIYKNLDFNDLELYKFNNNNRESQLEQYRVYQVVVNGIQAIIDELCSCKEYGLWSQYFTLKEAVRQKTIISKERFNCLNNSLNKGLNKKCVVISWVIEFDLNKATGNIEFGKEDSIDFSEIKKASFECLKENGKWLINEFNIIN